MMVTGRGRVGRAALWLAAGITFAFLVAPILAILPLSFSSGSFLSYPLPGFSLRWYEKFFASERWMLALGNSLIVGVASTIAATVLGTLAALGLSRRHFPWRALAMGVILAPMIVPTIILAVGMYFVFAPLRLNSTYIGLVLAHTALAVPFVVVTVDATLAGFDVNLMRAAASLGATPLTVFFRVVLPLILPGIVSGALFAFVVSFDEAVMALFIAGPNQTTLPRQMFNDLRESIDPTLVAVAMVLIVVSAGAMALIEALRRRVERMRALRQA